MLKDPQAWEDIENGLSLSEADKLAVRARAEHKSWQQVRAEYAQSLHTWYTPAGIPPAPDSPDPWDRVRTFIEQAALGAIAAEPSFRLSAFVVTACIDIRLDIAARLDALRRKLRTEDAKALYVGPPAAALENACHLLGVPVPSSGAIDEKLAAKNRRGLQQAYHVDRLGVADYDNERFLAVGEAFRVIEKYNESLKEEKC